MRLQPKPDLCGMERGVQAHVHDGVPLVFREVLHWAHELDASVVMQDV